MTTTTNNKKQQKTKQKKTGYDIKGKNSQPFYMDDLKLFSRDETKLQQKMNTVKMFSNVILMEFSLDKCMASQLKPKQYSN
jgi:hypothetical protein